MENLRAQAAMTNDCVLKAALANQKYSLTSRYNCKFLMHITDIAVGNHYYDDPKPYFIRYEICSPVINPLLSIYLTFARKITTISLL